MSVSDDPSEQSFIPYDPKSEIESALVISQNVGQNFVIAKNGGLMTLSLFACR